MAVRRLRTLLRHPAGGHRRFHGTTLHDDAFESRRARARHKQGLIEKAIATRITEQAVSRP
jgi:hypothetical protein